jgi:pyruvate dehydrogenase E2 component (dihydrolipoamide acetyltransferase)
MSEIVMPRLSDTMEEGTILRWLKHDGEHVKRGEELVEIETDKAAMTYESDSEGTLQTLAREGDTLAVGAPIARVGEEVNDAAAPHNGSASAEHESPRPDTPNGQAMPSMETHQPPETERSPAVLKAEHEPAAVEPPSPPPHSDERVKASPLARRIAREMGVDLGGLTGSGPGGRIVKADVEEVAGSNPAPATDLSATLTEWSPIGADPPPVTTSTHDRPPASVAGAPFDPVPATAAADIPATSAPPVEEVSSAKGETTVVELSRTQRTIARRMAESKATIPDFTLTADIDMERCVDLRAELTRLSRAGDGRGKATATVGEERDKTAAPTYNDMIVKACALALRDHPRANGSYRDGRFELHARVNVGVAVAAGSEDPTGGVLVVPTVFDADTKALGEIARETRALAERVRNGSITPPELSGGTFTVSNLGMYGIKSFTAIVNPPQAAILAVGTLAPRAVIRKKKLVARQTMSVTLACDHRILYGADAALFLARIRELLEEPAALTL